MPRVVLHNKLEEVSGPYGPQSTIACPGGAVSIPAGSTTSSRQTAIDANPNGTAFCLGAGIHTATGNNVPKIGNTFVGEYGAIIDGSSWTAVKADWSNNAVFKAFNVGSPNITDVTFRNLIIRNIPGAAIAGYYQDADRWIVENCELSYCTKVGVNMPNDSIVRNNYIHHCVGDLNDVNANFNGGGYLVFHSDGVLFDHNEISYNGPEQKAILAANVTFRNNFIHHNYNQGIWFDGENVGSISEGNLIEDNGSITTGGVGIFHENSGYIIVRNNIIRRQGWQGIALTTTRDTEVYGNLLEDCGRGITLNVFCLSPLGGGDLAGGFDLTNDYVHDNVIKVGSGAVWANDYVYSSCTAPEYAPYFDGATNKNNRFVNNTYYVPNTNGSYWHWQDGGLINWTAWQGHGQDLGGSVLLRF